MKKLLYILLSVIFLINVSGCGENSHSRIKLEDFIEAYSSYNDVPSSMSELFNINIDDAYVSKNSKDKKIVYSYILTEAKNSSEKIVEITITTDKKNYIESVVIDMDIAHAIYYGTDFYDSQELINMDFDTAMQTLVQASKRAMMLYDTVILYCLSDSDMSESEAVEKIMELDKISEDNQYLEINDTLSIAFNREQEGHHIFTVFLNNNINTTAPQSAIKTNTEQKKVEETSNVDKRILNCNAKKDTDTFDEDTFYFDGYINKIESQSNKSNNSSNSGVSTSSYSQNDNKSSLISNKSFDEIESYINSYVRPMYNYINDNSSGYTKSTSNGVTYWNDNKGCVKKEISSGVNGYNMTREYYYDTDSGRIFFAFIYNNSSEYRLYFRTNQLIRYISPNRQTFNNPTFSEAIDMADFVLSEAY